MSNKLIVASVLGTILGLACLNTEAMKKERPRGPTSIDSNFTVFIPGSDNSKVRIPTECITPDSEGYLLDINVLALFLQQFVQEGKIYVNREEYENRIVVAEFKFGKGLRVSDGKELPIYNGIEGIGDYMLEILKRHDFVQQKGLFANEQNRPNAVRDSLGWAIVPKGGRTWEQFGLKAIEGKLYAYGRDFE